MTNEHKIVSASLWKCQLFGFILIAAVTLFVYFPSFQHMPRADHYFYLGDISKLDSWSSLAVESYDWPRSRTFAPGDGYIFRPVAYFLMGTEQFFFRNNYVYWQITGVILHLLVVWFMLKLLLSIRPGLLAVMLAALYSLFFMNMEPVIWQHINSVLVAILMLLISLDQLYVYVYKQQQQPWRIWAVFTCMLVACFTYEICLIYTVLLFLFFCSVFYKDKQQRKQALWLIAPVVICLVASSINYNLLGTRLYDNSSIFRRPDIAMGINNTVLTFVWWMYTGLFPAEFSVVYSTGRAGFADMECPVFPFSVANPANIATIVLVVLYILTCLRLMTLRFVKQRAHFFGLLAAMILCWASMIAFYRIDGRGFKFTLIDSLHYYNLFWGLLIILLYSMIDFAAINKTRLMTALKYSVLAIMVFLVFINGRLVYRLNKSLAEQQQPLRVLVTHIESLIKQMGGQEDFSFYVDPDFPGNEIFNTDLRKEDPPGHRYSYIELLYLPYFDRYRPQFLFLSDKYQGDPMIVRTGW